jgi:hypothetical protein
MDKEVIKLEYGGGWHTGYNCPDTNERRVELPLAFWFINNYNDNLIELGEVTDFYIDAKHPVYDLCKEREHTTQMDISDVDYTGKNVVSISTIEHVGNGDYGHQKDENKVLPLLNKIFDNAKNYLITIPVGFNRDLEKVIVENNIEYILMVRDQNNNWKQVKDKELKDYKYGDPYSAGNAVAILTNLNVEFTFGD